MTVDCDSPANPVGIIDLSGTQSSDFLTVCETKGLGKRPSGPGHRRQDEKYDIADDRPDTYRTS